MSLTTALKEAPPGATVHLAPGRYPPIRDVTPRSRYLTLAGDSSGPRPTIAGATLWGSQYLRFEYVRFVPNPASAGSVANTAIYINHASTGTPTNHIQVLNSDIDCSGEAAAVQSTGMMVRGGASDITLRGDLVHNCRIGFTSVASDRVSRSVDIEHNTFAHFTGDAIDLGGLSSVVIDHNVISDIMDPARRWHDDAIQFFGNDDDVRITNNVIANSRDQLIFIQDAIKSQFTGSSVNRNILVARNLIYGAGAFAIQSQGGVDVRFINNTMWSNHFGSLLVRRSPFTGLKAPQMRIVGNIIEGYGLDHATPAVEDYNLFVKTPRQVVRGGHDLYNVNPHFVDPRRGDFDLASSSKALRFTTRGRLIGLTGQMAIPQMDGYGRPLTKGVSLGAVQPQDPSTAWGSAVFGATGSG